MQQTVARALAALALGALFVACSAPVKEQPQAGYISDYSRLEKVEKNAYRYISPALGQYSAFIVESPVILFDRPEDPDEQVFTDEELEELVVYYRDRLVKEISEDGVYSVVETPGEGVARMRTGITALDASTGLLNIAIYTKITGAGLGGIAMEGEIVDSLSGEQLAASLQWGTGSRLLRAGFTRLGDAKLKINKWAARLRSRIDEAHASGS